jgi:ABC-type polysaccharide/polyol phosphate transport system ATPase subunit
VAERPIAIEVEDLHKAFRIPSRRIETLKERVLHPFTPLEYATLDALRGISFHVRAGEFFGVAGRNGSGKTTLLKLIASIYRADRGRIRLAGTLAPFIELGVGFNPNFTARDNVLLNGVMMGLSPKEARRRFDAVIEFAELEDFIEMKLKNYSSGMSLRLAFALLTQSDADVMLVDEVLAVGDASFAQKCTDTFQRLRTEGRTIILVTHDMESLRKFCDHAIMIEGGAVELAGEPDEVAYRYMQINFSGPPKTQAPGKAEGYKPLVGRIAEVWLEDDDGDRAEEFAHGELIHLVATIEARQVIERPGFSFEIFADDGARLFATPTSWTDEHERLEPGERIRFKATVKNALNPGRFRVRCSLARRGNGFDFVDTRDPGAEFVVWGVERWHGYVGLDWHAEFERDPEAGRVKAAGE